MQTIATILLCLAYAVHGRRIREKHGQMHHTSAIHPAADHGMALKIGRGKRALPRNRLHYQSHSSLLDLDQGKPANSGDADTLILEQLQLLRGGDDANEFESSDHEGSDATKVESSVDEGGDANESESNVDEGLYSRQLYVLGHAAQRSLSASSVLLLGISGLGAEVAKNIVLAGVGSLDVYDPVPTTYADLSSSFLLHDDDVGSPRHDLAAERLAPLNPYVRVRVMETGPFSSVDNVTTVDEAMLSGYTVAVAVDQPHERLLQLDAACRRSGCRLLVCDSRGVFGRIFCDFGETFMVDDVDGETPKSALLEHVATSEDGEVTCVPEQPHGLVDGDVIRFEEVDGMPSLCAPGKTFTVKVLSRFVISVGSTLDAGTYNGGGRIVQIKQPCMVTFAPLADALASPEILPTQMDPPERLQTIHACFACAGAVLSSTTEGETLLTAVKASGLLAHDTDIVQDIIEDFADGMAGSLSPMAAYLGGIAAQEVIKACTHRYTPLQQFLYVDASSCLPSPRPSREERLSRGDRYDGQRAVLGHSMIETLGKLHYFVVGAGAIGCELLKCLALMGVGCGADGQVHVTDMDTIERSNLNRQFLFRPTDVGKAKSLCAAAAANRINPDLQILTYEERVGEDSDSFHEDFWRSLDGVANALDNVQARLYVDRCCVNFGLPLLESGTSGTKGNTQVVLPGLSESYGSAVDPPEPTIPVCTLKSFPYLIEHTLQWARDAFEGEFAQAPEAINQWLDRPEYLADLMRDTADNLPTAVDAIYEGVLARPSSAHGAASCVRWARAKFDVWFYNSIRSLCNQFPPDHLTEQGEPFWSGTRRRPTPILFDPSNEAHMKFIAAAARLRAQTLSLTPPSLEEVATLLATLETTDIDEWSAQVDDDRVASTEEEAKKLAQSGPSAATRQRLDERMSKLRGPEGAKARANSSELRAAPESFEKDDDSNGHMEFITAASNLRAANYGIPPADMHKSKLIAGRIVPAIATTTACVVGLVCLELLKLVQYPDDLERFRNGFLNLALPLVAFSEPWPAEEFDWPSSSETWNLWSRLNIESESELTLQQLVSKLEEKLGLEISFLSSGATTLYSSLAPPADQRTWLGMGVRSVIEEATRKPLRGQTVLLQASCYNEKTEEDVEIPTIAYRSHQAEAASEQSSKKGVKLACESLWQRLKTRRG